MTPLRTRLKSKLSDFTNATGASMTESGACLRGCVDALKALEVAVQSQSETISEFASFKMPEGLPLPKDLNLKLQTRMSSSVSMNHS